MSAPPLTIALAGNPNVGKSTIFNGLTGIRQHTGNWPGKTVEKKEGIVRLDNGDVIVVDLPGTYSLTAYSIEETISRDFIIDAHPDLVIVVVDAANLERNLYLVMQVLESGTSALLALNMLDMAKKRGIDIDTAILSEQLGGIPIIKTVGSDGIGLDEIRQYLQKFKNQPPQEHFPFDYTTHIINTAIINLVAHIETETNLAEHYPARWLAIKLLEEDPQIQADLEQRQEQTLLSLTASILAEIERTEGETAEILITDERYQHINDIVDAALSRTKTQQETWTDRIDAIATHRYAGIPVFLLLMWLVFQFTANVSAPLVDWIDSLFAGPVNSLFIHLFNWIGIADSWFASLVLDGAIPGVGGVLVFIPVLMSLYIAIALLEDTGYMARAAFVMDRGMRSLGLHGKSFLPMLVGFGCTVPAVYATRTLENERERKLTGFLLNFMSCGARLPVYVVFGAAFFGAQSGNLIFGMYILGIFVALLTGFIIRKTVMKNDPVQPFVMELPPYRAPRPGDMLLQTWERTFSFIRKATSVILGMAVLIWFMLAIPVNGGDFNAIEPGDSLFGRTAEIVSPVFAPAGFGDWQASGSLITGMVAKEVIIGTMSQIYVGVEGETSTEPLPPFSQEIGNSVKGLGTALLLTGQEFINILPRTINLIPYVTIPELSLQGNNEEEASSQLESALTQHFTPVAAVAFTAFVLLYVPCITTLVAMNQEFGKTWMLQQIAYTFLVAWAVAVIIFQIGSRIGGIV